MSLREMGERLAAEIRRESSLSAELEEVKAHIDALIASIRSAPDETAYENTGEQTLIRPYMDDAAYSETMKLSMSGNATVEVGMSAIVLCPAAGVTGAARAAFCRWTQRHAHTADGKVHVLS